jgi:hypothetical protein
MEGHGLEKFTGARLIADVVWFKEGANDHAASFIRDHCGNLIEFIQGPRPLAEVASL